MKKILLSLLVCFVVFSSIAEDIDSKNKKTSQAAGISIEQHNQELIIAELKAQNAVLRDYQQHLLSTVYWSLGILSGIGLLLSGYSWYSNFRIYDREKAELVGVLQDLVKTETQKAVMSIQERWADIKNENQTQINVSTNTLRSEIKAVKKETEKLVIPIQIKLLDKDADDWEAKKVYNNVIREMLEKIEISKKCSDWQTEIFTSEALDRIISVLPNTRKPDTEFTRDISKTIESLGATYKVSVGRIMTWLNTV